MATPREHIEQIRKLKFSIGKEENPLTEELHNAVKHLSAELYTKDVHFLMELIQNAQDNDYPSHVDPSLEFILTKRDITGAGAPATLLVFNNEKGFTFKNIESLCSVGKSTRKGKRQGGYIGEKGIGFKSVFLVTSQPYIFSNGYQIRFNEIPPADTKLGYTVPEWVDDKPDVKDLLNVYYGHSEGKLPTTVIILPLREEKVEAVKQQLANIHPEVILFMSKIKRLSFREDNQNRVNTISVSKEIEFRTVKDHQSESFTLDLSAQENGMPNSECSCYMWRQTFPVKEEDRVEGRKEVENWADFLLVSSRESIRWDSKWNQGILDCVPSAFCQAFKYLGKTQVSAPPSSRSYFFDRYLPISYPSYTELRTVQDAIQAKFKTEEIIPCEGGITYCTPLRARRILPAFRNILQKAEGGSLEKPTALWSTGAFVLHPCMDDLRSLDFLGVQYVGYDWYSTCINGCGSDWVAKFSEDVYVQLLCFVADNWKNGVFSSGFRPFRLFKYLTDGYIQRVGWQVYQKCLLLEASKYIIPPVAQTLHG
ncbi:hypothetical protein KI387_000811 [Taxus chinensis]|uniref:Sacsin/Nov domain-containing protein n=1 Tax=Taxus chinensis TaxID=29808 RepID=A0AA38GTT3_TAXCH|nr:hypothetical protein KI387_000811 [Taxus chinensis]